MVQQNLSSLIWNANDDVLRGIFKPSEYTQAILPFILMRRMDCVNVNTSNLTIKDVAQQLDNYLNGFETPIREIINAFNIEPIVKKLERFNRLELFLSKFEDYNLHPDIIDNHQMGTVYEELLGRYAESTNASNGEHYTPRDIIELLVALVFADEQLIEGQQVSLYDPCCGTGGILTLARDWLLNKDSNVKVELYGQEINTLTWAICQADILLSGGDPNNIGGPKSSLSEDYHCDTKFDYMISNPPFGVNWKEDKAVVETECNNKSGRFNAGVPRLSDGSLLFLQHMVHKMHSDRTSRIGIIFNASPMFTGGAESGESNIRRWILENDLLDAIVALPESMFYNTAITTYIWIVTNKKSVNRQGHVQLIDARLKCSKLRKKLGYKSNYISKEQVKDITTLYRANAQNNLSKILPNNHFGYTNITVEQPLVQDNKDLFARTSDKHLTPDPNKRDTERVPLCEDIEEFFEREVKPFCPDAWVDRSKDKLGYEIEFLKEFYTFKPLRSLEDIEEDLSKVTAEIESLSDDCYGDSMPLAL